MKLPYTIIAFAGKAGAGKDYTARNVFLPLIQKKTLIVAFADQLKIQCMKQYNLTFEDVFIDKIDSTRKLLQREGTHFDERWCHYLDTWMKIHHYKNGIDCFLITDLRFQYEAHFLRAHYQNVFLIYVRNEIESTYDAHISEIDLDNREDLFDYSFINSRLDDIEIVKIRMHILRAMKQETTF